jgi:hypothetical protein
MGGLFYVKNLKILWTVQKNTADFIVVLSDLIFKTV